QELEMIEHRMAGREIELAGDADALRPTLDAVEFYAVVEDHLFAAGQPPEEIEVPPGAAVFAVGRELEADLLLFPDDLLDLAVVDGSKGVGRDLALLALGARLLERRAAQDRADMIGAERRLAALHGRMSDVRCQRTVGSCVL